MHLTETAFYAVSQESGVFHSIHQKSLN